MEEISVTRQAIYNAHHEVVGYELLYTDGHTLGGFPCSDAEQSAHLIAETFIGIGLENLVGSSMAFINLSHDFFSNEHPIPMASYQLVLEVPGTCLEDDKIYAELTQLARQGYTLSVYDYQHNELSRERLDCIDIVKLDMVNNDTQSLKEQSRYFRNHGKRLHIKGIDSDAHQLLCGQLGVDYFQGNLYSSPRKFASKSVACCRQVLRAIEHHAEQHPDDLATMVQVISQDVGLCYKVLRYINCASFAARSEIQSLQQALKLIGSETLKKWASLLLTASTHLPENATPNTRPLIRAEMCRKMASRYTEIKPDTAYLAGLFSSLHEEMSTPLEDLFDSVSINIDITLALLFNEGQLGHLLQQLIHCEAQDWDALDTSRINVKDCKEGYQLAQHVAQS